MRPTGLLSLFVLAAVALTVGCSNNTGKIEGTKWNSRAKQLGGISLPAGAVQLEFGKSGSFVYRVGAGKVVYEGTYTLGSGDTVFLDCTTELGGHKTYSQNLKISGDKLTEINDYAQEVEVFDRAQ